MKLFIDTANVDEIRETNDMGIICGVTTNPSLIAKEGRDYMETLKEIADIVDGPISGEVKATTTDAEGMIAEGREIAAIHPNMVVKIPMTTEGLKAIKVLSREKIKTNCTLIFSANHPLAAKPADELSLRDFKDDLFIAPWEIVDKLIVEAISNYTRPYGFIPKVRFVKNHESTITCVRNNMGVMIADEWVWAKGADDLKWIPFNSSDSIAITRLKSKDNENVLLMEKILKEIIAENSGK